MADILPDPGVLAQQPGDRVSGELEPAPDTCWVRAILLPAGADSAARLGTELGLAELIDLYAVPAQSNTWLRVNMVSTLDGAATGADGRSGSINTPADQVIFELLRAIADAVVVGAGTVRAESYPPLRLSDEYAAVRAAAGLPAALPLVVVSRSGALPAAVLTQHPDAPVHAVLPEHSPHARRVRAALGVEHVHVCGATEVDLPEALGSLHAAGLRRLQSEGGPRLLGDLLRAGLVDELDLTIAPSLAGGPFPRIVGGPPLHPPTATAPLVLLEEQGSLIGRWLIGGPTGAR
jgi:riboflavin biosynthesis pyrimidine reductase